MIFAHMTSAESVATELVNDLSKSSYAVRIWGGVAYTLLTEWQRLYGSQRPVKDIDLVTRYSIMADVVREISQRGGRVDKASAITTDKRLARMSYKGFACDLYSDPLHLNQKIELGDRLTLDPYTLTKADLLATKLQIVQPSDRDFRDVAALIASSCLSGDKDASFINMGRIQQLGMCSWGFYHSCVGFLTQLSKEILEFKFSSIIEATVSTRIEQMLRIMQEAPKSRSWKIRDRIGERFKWYNMIEDSDEALRSELRQSETSNTADKRRSE